MGTFKLGFYSELCLLGLTMQNSKLMLSAVVAAGAMLGIGAASAADLAVKAMPYAAPAPVFNWTGCYVGVHAGAGAMRVSGGLQKRSGSGETGTGGLAGGQLGCNYQDGNWVFGAEGEGYWSGMKATDANSSTNSEGFITDRTTYDTKNKYDFSIAARAGIAFDRTLVYGKAGWVWGQFDFLRTNAYYTGSAPNTLTDFYSHAASGTLNGLLLGVGIEHAITNNWTVKLEYNYLRYGSKELSITECTTVPTTTPACIADGTESHHADKQIFKIGVNYLFNMAPAAVVAKY
jgi:outer membrane immunogenic protein